MKIRSVVAVATIATFGLTACGGSDGPNTLSQDDFVARMADICHDTQRDLDQIDAPQDLAGIEQGAGEAIKVLTDTRERLGKLLPPTDLVDDFADFTKNVDDQLDALDDLKQAGKDQDEDKVNDVSAELGELSTRRSDLGDKLGVDECVNDATTDTSDVPGTDVPGSDVPATDEPSADPTVAVSAPPLTLPPTLPPQTIAPTVPVDTTPASGQQFAVVDLTTDFVAPDGFTLVNADPTAAQQFIDIVASVPELNTGIEQMGVSVLLDGSGTPIATIVLGTAIGDSMPGQWKDILCGTDGILRTSAGGFTGIFCPGPAGSGVSEIFTLTSGDVGLSVATLVPTAAADLVVDAFYEANF